MIGSAKAQTQDFIWARAVSDTASVRGLDIATDSQGNIVVTGQFIGTPTFGTTQIVATGLQSIFVAKWDSDGNFIWVQDVDDVFFGAGTSVAIDLNDNILVTGYFENQAVFGGTTLNSVGPEDIFVAKYDQLGNVVWAKRAGADGTSDWGQGIAVDGNGNAYVTGYFTGTADFGAAGQLNATGGNEIFISKYDQNGNELWAQPAGSSTGNDEGRGIAVSAAGEVFVTGIFQDFADFGGAGSINSNQGSLDIFVAHYDVSGFGQWVVPSGGNGQDEGFDIAIDPSGHPIAVGWFTGNANFGLTGLTSNGLTDGFVAKYDSSNGNVFWSRQVGDTGNDEAASVVIDPAGWPTLVGSFEGSVTLGSTTINASGQNDIYVAQFDGEGNDKWLKQAGGGQPDWGNGISLYQIGNYYITGSFHEQANFDAINLNFTPDGIGELYVARLDAFDVHTDSLSLLVLYNNTDGDNWTSNANWRIGPVSTWFGVNVTGNRVTNLNLPNNNLIGQFPFELSYLTDLNELQLNNNQLTGPISQELENLQNLTILNLNTNQLSEGIPPPLGNLTTLTLLDLSGNPLGGTIPTELGDITSLNTLTLQDNQLTGSIPTELANLSNLTSLNLSTNQLDGSIPNAFNALTNLIDLQLDSNQLNGSIPAWLGSIPNLVTLNLSQNQFTGTIPSELGNASELTQLNLNTNQLNGNIPTEIGNMANLEFLMLSHNRFSGAVPASIVNLDTLKGLYVSSNYLSVIPDLTVIDSLTNLYIQNNRFTFEDLEMNITKLTDPAGYAPQDSVGAKTDTTVVLATAYTMSINVGGTANQYQWLKNGAEIPGATATLYTLNSTTEADTGAYICRITNTIATACSLYSRPFNVTVTAGAPDIQLSATGLDFQSVELGSQSDLNFNITSNGNIDLEITSTTIEGNQASDFSIVSGSGAATLPPGNVRAVNIRFMPQQLGQRNAILVIQHNTESSPDTVTLTGTGTSPTLALSANALDFGEVRVNATKADTVITSNPGTAQLSVTSIGISGTNSAQFDVTATPYTVDPAGAHPLQINFTPNSPGNFTATLVLSSNAADTTVGLTGSGVASELSASSDTLNFGVIPVGSNNPNSVWIRNTGTASLNVQTTTLAGNHPSDWTITSGAGQSTTAVSDSTQITLTFTPSVLGQRNALLILASDALSNPDTLALIGTGTDLWIETEHPEPVAGTGLAISSSLSTPFIPTTAQLYYRMGGQTDYQSIDLVLSGQSYSATIPASYMTPRGVEYYVRMSDGNLDVTLPAANPVTVPNLLQIQVNQYTCPLSFETLIYRMVSVPVILENPDLASVLTDDYGEYDIKQWRFLKYHPQDTSDYDEYPNIASAFTPGNGFWLVTARGESFDVNDGISLPSNQAYTVTLDTGWNQIGNPFAFPIAWDDVDVSGNVDAPVFWDGTDYTYNVTVVDPWEGFFVMNRELTQATVTFPPVESTTRSKPSSYPLVLNEDDFVIQLSASALGYRFLDRQNFIGIRSGATDGIDLLDFYEAPPIGEYIKLSIMEDENCMAGSFKNPNEQGFVWDLEAITSHPEVKKITVKIDQLNPLPDGMNVYILDKDAGRALSVANNRFNVSIKGRFSPRHLSLILGDESYAESNSDGISLMPHAFELYQNYPNPFNPETKISYRLREASHTKLEIFNVMGKRIRILVNSEQGAGLHTINWDGKDESGKILSGGVYFYRLWIDDFAKTRKLVLVR